MHLRRATIIEAEDWNALFHAVKFRMRATVLQALAVSPSGLMAGASAHAAWADMVDCILALDKLQELLSSDPGHRRQRRQAVLRCLPPDPDHADARKQAPAVPGKSRASIR